MGDNKSEIYYTNFSSGNTIQYNTIQCPRMWCNVVF